MLALLTRFDKGRTKSVLRLDWFVPYLRKISSDQWASPSLAGRTLRKILPVVLQSDRVTKQRGVVRRTLRSIGLSWLASPVRRIVQAVCLLVFLCLFFLRLLAIPRLAATDGASFQRDGHSIKSIRSRAKYILASSSTLPAELLVDATLFVFDESAPDLKVGALGAFRVATIFEDSIRLKPHAELTPELLDAFFTSVGPWALHETDPIAWPSHYADDLARKEIIPAETFLILDPLVSLSTAVAARSWVWSLASAAIILLVCLLIPRGFLRLSLPTRHHDRPVRLGDCGADKTVPRTRRRLVGPHQVLFIGWHDGLCCVRRVDLRILRSHPRHHTRPALFIRTSAKWHAARLAPCTRDEYRTCRFAPAVFRGAMPRVSQAAILVQVRLSERGSLFTGQSVFA